MQQVVKRTLVLIFGLFVAVALAFTPSQKRIWRPNKIPADVKFVGSQACVECHAEKVKTQSQTSMGQALEPVATSVILRQYPKLTFKSGLYTYEILRQGTQSIYQVTDGKTTLSASVLYAIGQAHAG